MWDTTSDPSGTVADPQVTCGCAGGGKFWNTAGATVADNWVHGNGDVGIWVDTDNSGFDISEQLHRFQLGRGHHLRDQLQRRHHRQHADRQRLGWWSFAGARWLPRSGPLHFGVRERQPSGRGRYGPMFNVSGNGFVDNWGGIVIYENSNRACGISNDQYCTLAGPGTYTMSSCAAHIPNGSTTATPDYVDNCRWKSENVSVDDNVFDFTPSDIGADSPRRSSAATTGCSVSPGPPRARLTTGLGPRGRAIPTGAMPSRTTSPTTSTTPTQTTPTAPGEALPGTSSPSPRAME